MTLNRIWKIGVTNDMDLEDQKPIMFSNGVYFIAAFVLLLAEVLTGGFIQVFRNPSLRALMPFILSGLAIFCCLLNKFGFFTLSRILFIGIWSFMVSVLPVISREPTSSLYYFHPIYIILFSPAIHLLFSHPKDKNILLVLLSMSLVTVIFSVDFLLAYDNPSQSHNPFTAPVMRVRIIFLALWLFINLMMAYVLKTNWNFYQALREQKELIATQRKKLEIQNEELLIANQKLIDLNEQIHLLNEALEKRVIDRTQELTERNKILSDYAFMNAHLLRSPVSRIIGLINLFNITDDQNEKKIVGESLSKSAAELDEVVRSISKKLNEVK